MIPLTENHWRITKYDPTFRDEKGAYLKDDWISFSDIGLSFDDKVLTFEEYRKVEDAYVFTALHFLSEANLGSLKINSLEKNKPRIKKSSLIDISYDSKIIENGLTVFGKDLEDVCRLVLRNVIWCRLESDLGFYIHFGWDYYMYIGSPVSSQKAISFGISQNIFVEKMISPYLDADDESQKVKFN